MGLNPGSIIQAVTAILASLATLVGLANRSRRLRHDVHESLSLLQELEKDEFLKDNSPASGWLRGKIVVDVAKLTGYRLGTPRKPVPKAALTVAVIFLVGFGFWTYYINRNGFVWYSVFTGLAAFLFGVSIFGMLTDRQLPPEAAGVLPPGAVPMRTDTASEQVATAVALASLSEGDDRFSDSGQIGVVYKFFGAMREGRVEEGFALSDPDWQLCMVQTWLWRTRRNSFARPSEVNDFAARLLRDCDPTDVWEAFVSDVSRMFISEWGLLDPESWGAASNRRRIAFDYDLVIVAPIVNGQGYFVTTATLIPDNMRFVVHHLDGRWLIAHHAGMAPPRPGWPPAWWVINDPDLEQTSDGGSSAKPGAAVGDKLANDQPDPSSR
jgi:hypothetical protein